CGQRRFAATAGVHCDWKHRERRIAHTRPYEDRRQTLARYRSRARSSRWLVHVRETIAAGSPRDRGARDDFRGERVEARAAASAWCFASAFGTNAPTLASWLRLT